MDQDKELLRALIERRQQMLAKMGDQIKKEHQGIEEKLAHLITALDSKLLIQENAKDNRADFLKEN